MAPTPNQKDIEYLQKLIPMDCEVINLAILSNLSVVFMVKVEHMHPKYWYGWSNLMDNNITIFRPIGGIWRDVVFDINELNFDKAEEVV
jgi:hypothetical protein